jgi:hypothetical protein
MTAIAIKTIVLVGIIHRICEGVNPDAAVVSLRLLPQDAEPVRQGCVPNDPAFTVRYPSRKGGREGGRGGHFLGPRGHDGSVPRPLLAAGIGLLVLAERQLIGGVAGAVKD